MRMTLPQAADERGWRTLFIAGMAAAILFYILDVFIRPSLEGSFDMVIHDDARQFLTWMPRLVDPAAMPGDWMADFWQSVSPPAYKAIFWLAAQIGIAPQVFARILPALLLLVSGAAAWRLAQAMKLPTPVAFCAAAFLIALLLKEDSLFSGTPRGLAIPFLLFFLDALLRERWRVIFACSVVLALSYPSLAVVSWTMLGLSRLRLWHLAGGWSDFWRLGASGAVIAVLLLLFREQTGQWGPVLTLDAARSLPGLMEPGARSVIVDENGRIDYLCSMRMGFLPEIIPCGRGIPLDTLWNILFLSPLLWLAWQGATAPEGSAQRANRLYLWALVAALMWFVVAALVPFRLHLPSRFSQRMLYPLEWMAIGQVLGQWLYDRSMAGVRALRVRMAGWGVAVFLLVSFASPLPLLREPDDPAMIRAIRALPAESRVSGVSPLMDFIPTIAGRMVAGTPQHAIPWQTGYYRRVREGMEDAIRARFADDPQMLRTLLERSGGTHVLLVRRGAGLDMVSIEYEEADTRLTGQARAALAQGPSLLEQFAEACRVHQTGLHDLLLTECVLEQLEKTQ